MTRLLVHVGERFDGIRTIRKADPTEQKMVFLGELSLARQALDGGSQKPSHVECVAASNQEASR